MVAMLEAPLLALVVEEPLLLATLSVAEADPVQVPVVQLQRTSVVPVLAPPLVSPMSQLMVPAPPHVGPPEDVVTLVGEWWNVCVLAGFVVVRQ